MPAYFMIIQFVPDPVAGERINIGVVTFDRHRIYCQFTNDWSAIRRFSGQDPHFLKQFADRLHEAATRQEVMEGLPGAYRATPDRLRDWAANWQHSIQFTEPCASLKAAEPLLEETVCCYLRHRMHKKREGRTRIDAAKIAAHEVKTVLELEIGKEQADHLFRRRYELRGCLDSHYFDVAVANGHPFFVAQGLSYEVQDPGDLRRSVNSVKWILSDVRRAAPDLPVGVVALPPNSQENTRLYRSSVKVFEQLQADVVSEANLSEWVSKQMKNLPESFRQAALEVPGTPTSS